MIRFAPVHGAVSFVSMQFALRNENTLDPIIEKSSQLLESIMLKEHCTVSSLLHRLLLLVLNIGISVVV